MNVRWVLVRPRNPLNIGAAARAMANFGFSDMAVVKPYAPVWKETRSAVGAEKLVLAAEAFGSIEDALRDCVLVIGTTALRERRRERPVVALPELAGYLQRNHPEYKAGRTAILFGPEKTGLTGAYLARCHFWLTVPTDPACPSMNLAQSVAVCAYEWGKLAGLRGIETMEPEPADMESRRRLARHALEVFDAVNFLPFLTPADRLRKIRERLLLWRLRRQDAAFLHGFFRFALRKMGKSG